MSLASSSSAFLIQSTSAVSAKPLPSTSLQSTFSSKDKNGAAASDAFVEVFARSQAASDARSQSETQQIEPRQAPAPVATQTSPDYGFGGVAPAQRSYDEPPVAPDTGSSRNDPPAADETVPSKRAADSAGTTPGAAKPRHAEENHTARGRGKTAAERAGKAKDQPASTDEAADAAATDEPALEDLSAAKAQGKHRLARDRSVDGLAETAKADAGDASDGTALATTSVTLPAPSLDLEATTLGLTLQPASSVATAVVAGEAETKPPSKTDSIGASGAGAILGQAASLFLKLALKADAGEAAAPAGQQPGAANAVAANGAARTETVQAQNALFDAGASLGLKPATDQASGVGSSAEPGIKALGAALKAGASALAPTSSIVLPQALAALAADAPQAAAKAVQSAEAPSTTLAALPVAIGSRALNGVREFTIHLYPAELGKVEVKLEISDKGDIRANLQVDRVETLQLLQRDAHTLHRALEQAGFRPSENGIEVSLRQDGQQASSQRQPSDQQARMQDRSGGVDKDATPVRDVTLHALAAYQRRGAGALDIHV